MSGYRVSRLALRGCGIAACAAGALLLAALPAQSQSVERSARRHFDYAAAAPIGTVSSDAGNTGQAAEGTSRADSAPQTGVMHSGWRRAGTPRAPERRIGVGEREPIASFDGIDTRSHGPLFTARDIPPPTRPSDGSNGNDNAPVNGPLPGIGDPAGFPIGPPAGFPIGPPAGMPIGEPAGLTMPQLPDPPRNTTPIGPFHHHPRRNQGYGGYGYNGGYNGGYPGYYGGDTVIVPGSSTIIISGTSTYLGGFYYGFYTNSGYGDNTYPSVYYMYSGFPQYICPPSIQVIQPYQPQYYSDPCAFRAPTEPVIYKEVVYYVDTPKQAADVESGGVRARKTIHTAAFPADSYQAAFGDIERAWTEGNLTLLRRHLRDQDSKISVYLGDKYAYSLSSGDFAQITRDALDRLSTMSFKFNKLRKAKNGVVTAYGRHVYQSLSSADETPVGETVPFDSSGSGDDGYSSSNSGVEKTVYVAYTLRHRGGQWYIISVATSSTELGGDY